MKKPSSKFILPALILATAATGCVMSEDEAGEDAIDEVGVDGGKSDGTSYSACELKNVVDLLNGGISQSDLQAKGVAKRAAGALVKSRNGADGRFGTPDDKPFANITAVDNVSYVGTRAIQALVNAIADRCVAPADAFAEARDVNKQLITFPAGSVADDYSYPDGGEFSLGGTEFWQRWSGGHSPTFDFSEGTPQGRLCMQASAIRFAEIMKNPPTEITALLSKSNWSGSFFNWNDDYTNASFGSGASRLWAWKTHLIKWISVTNKDGSCSLPTLDMLKRAGTACQQTADRSNKEIEGCQAR